MCKSSSLQTVPSSSPRSQSGTFASGPTFRPGDSVANRVRLLRERSGRTDLPVTFVVSSAAELLGSAMLIHHEMDTHPQFTPWLAGVFVAPAHRGHGIGRMAHEEHVVREAAARGYSTVYLFTPSAANLVSHLGWSIVEHTLVPRLPTSLSCRTPNSPKPIAGANPLAAED